MIVDLCGNLPIKFEGEYWNTANAVPKWKWALWFLKHTEIKEYHFNPSRADVKGIMTA